MAFVNNFNSLIMTTQDTLLAAVYYGLGANWLTMLPLYKGIIKSNVIDNPKYNPPVKDPYLLRYEVWRRGNRVGVVACDTGGFDGNILTDMYSEWDDKLSSYNKRVSKTIESNFFNRKPFTCLYCLTFWLALIGSVLVPLIWEGKFLPGACFVAPVIAVAFDRWFNSFSIKL